MGSAGALMNGKDLLAAAELEAEVSAAHMAGEVVPIDCERRVVADGTVELEAGSAQRQRLGVEDGDRVLERRLKLPVLNATDGSGRRRRRRHPGAAERPARSARRYQRIVRGVVNPEELLRDLRQGPQHVVKVAVDRRDRVVPARELLMLPGGAQRVAAGDRQHADDLECDVVAVMPVVAGEGIAAANRAGRLEV